MTKFMYNGIKFDGKLHKGHYSKGPFTNLPEGTITIYARDYTGFPQIKDLTVKNNSDSMTDYFEKDRVRVTPDNPYYAEVLGAYTKQEQRQKR